MGKVYKPGMTPAHHVSASTLGYLERTSKENGLLPTPHVQELINRIEFVGTGLRCD